MPSPTWRPPYLVGVETQLTIYCTFRDLPQTLREGKCSKCFQNFLKYCTSLTSDNVSLFPICVTNNIALNANTHVTFHRRSFGIGKLCLFIACLTKTDLILNSVIQLFWILQRKKVFCSRSMTKSHKAATPVCSDLKYIMSLIFLRFWMKFVRLL